MKSARVSEALIGNHIKEPVYTENGNLLLKPGCLIDNKVLNKLLGHNVDFVYIVDSLTDGIEQESIINQEKHASAVKSVKNIFNDVMKEERMGAMSSVPNIHLDLVEKIIDSLLSELENAGELLYTIVDLIDTDPYTYKHSVNVTILTIIVAKQLKYKKSDIKNIAFGALLHDIGKVRVDMGLILKPGKLTVDEIGLVQEHPELGYELVEAIDRLPFLTKQIIRLHHEKLDGSGYPLGLKGIEIPEYVRIVTVCDMYDAMTTDRVYRSRMPIYRALDILMAEAVYRIDPKIYTTLMRNIAIYPVGTGVILSDGSIGVVTSYRNVNPCRPCVRVLSSKPSSKMISLKEINLENSPVLFIEDVWDVEIIKQQRDNEQKLLEIEQMKTEMLSNEVAM